MHHFKTSNHFRELTPTEIQSVSGGLGLLILGATLININNNNTAKTAVSSINNRGSNPNSGLPGALGDNNTTWLPWFNNIVHATWAKPIVNSPWMQTPGMQNIIKSPWFHSIAARH